MQPNEALAMFWAGMATVCWSQALFYQGRRLDRSSWVFSAAFQTWMALAVWFKLGQFIRAWFQG